MNPPCLWNPRVIRRPKQRVPVSAQNGPGSNESFKKSSSKKYNWLNVKQKENFKQRYAMQNMYKMLKK